MIPPEPHGAEAVPARPQPSIGLPVLDKAHRPLFRSPADFASAPAEAKMLALLQTRSYMRHSGPLLAIAFFSMDASAAGESSAVPAGHPYTLNEIQQRARSEDLRVLAAEADLRAYHAMYEQAAWAWFPKLETFLSLAGPMPQAQTAPNSPSPYLQVTQASTLYNLDFGQPGVYVGATVTGVIPIFTFGKLTALREAAEQGVIIGESLRERARAEAVYQCAEAWYGYQLARTIDENLNDSDQQLSDAKKRVTDMLRVDSTQVTKLDAYKVEFFENLLATQHASAKKGREVALAALRILAGVAETAPFAVVDEDLVDPHVEVQPMERYIAAALVSRPEVRLAVAGVEAREREVRIRERMFYPDLFLAGGVTATHSSTAEVVTNPFFYDRYNQFSGGVGLGARVTFDFPIKLAQLSQAEAERDKTLAERALLNKAVTLEVKQTVGELTEALSRMESYTKGERTARRWATGAFADFEVGLSDTRELVESIAAKSVAGSERLRALHDAQVAMAALQRVVGVDPRTVH
jgi:outer membrane protein, multidrug efflux system